MPAVPAPAPGHHLSRMRGCARHRGRLMTGPPIRHPARVVVSVRVQDPSGTHLLLTMTKLGTAATSCMRLFGSAVTQVLGQLIAQDERMLHAMPHGGAAVALEALQVSRCGAGDHGIGLLRLAAFEYASALKHKGAGLAANSSNHPLEPYERSRAVAAVHH